MDTQLSHAHLCRGIVLRSKRMLTSTCSLLAHHTFSSLNYICYTSPPSCSQGLPSRAMLPNLSRGCWPIAAPFISSLLLPLPSYDCSPFTSHRFLALAQRANTAGAW